MNSQHLLLEQRSYQLVEPERLVDLPQLVDSGYLVDLHQLGELALLYLGPDLHQDNRPAAGSRRTGLPREQDLVKEPQYFLRVIRQCL